MADIQIRSKGVEQAVILAGGFGTRLKPFTDSNPKPMYRIQGKPFLEYLVEQIRDFGIVDIIMLLGYLPERIMEYFGKGDKWGVRIQYCITPAEYETGTRLKEAHGNLQNRFLLMYCDNYCPIDYNRLLADFSRNNADIQITAYTNRDGYTKDNLSYMETGLVVNYDKSRLQVNLSGVDIGYAIVSKKTLDLLPAGNTNFEAVVYPQLVEENRLFATLTEHRYYSCGSWERMALTEEFFKSKRCVFLDRDGTLNIRPPQACYIEKPEDFYWLGGAQEAIKLFNDAGYLVVLVSNQPGIARGYLTVNDLSAIQEKMVVNLAKIGAHIDAFYYCKHDWNEGCFCRKPSPGLLYEAQKDFSINLTKAILIGDDSRDIHAGEMARCTCFYVNRVYTLLDAANDILTADERRTQ